MAKGTFGDLYGDFIAKHPRRAARSLKELRDRRERVAAGGDTPSRFDTVESIDTQIANYLRGFAMAACCEDCGEHLDDEVSVARKVGPRCWARRQARTTASQPPLTPPSLDPNEAF